MKKQWLLGFMLCVLINIPITSQNLLNTSSWTVGSGSVSGFSQNGGTSENSRELGKNHIGENVVLWKASPNSSRDADGGWNSGGVPINHTKTYRFSVWIKKTNSTNGTTYLGCRSQDNILKLDGNVNNNPYFWYGDLPRLNRWYLVVGFVHGSGHTAKVNTGGVYDGTTGEKVRSTTDYKFKNTATTVAHRSYLYYDTNTSDRQYFYEPRIELVTGSEPSVNQLLKINTNSKLGFTYDAAGNQTQGFYCKNATYCSPSSGRAINTTRKKEVVAPKETLLQESTIDVVVYPNPTEGLLTVQLNTDDLSKIHEIGLYDVTANLLQEVAITNNRIVVDLTNKPDGVYFIHVHVHQGKSITKKVIKK